MSTAAVARREHTIRQLEKLLHRWDEQRATLPEHLGGDGADGLARHGLLTVLTSHVGQQLADCERPSDRALLAVAGHALVWLEAIHEADETNPAAGEDA